ncbi:MAG: hypothetical protein ACTHKZ_11095 [Lysobacteraceae bacterium]
MKPFVLKQHDKDYSALRELRDEELQAVAGGMAAARRKTTKLNTVTVTPNGDGGDDGQDEG